MFSGMPAGFLKVAAVALVTVGVAVALLATACGGSDGGSPIVQAATTLTVTVAPQSTALPTATATPQPPAPTATPQPPAPTATPQPPAPTATQPSVGCPKRMHNHLNIDKLRLQPGMADAIITEIDDSSILIVLQGVEFIAQGWAKLVGVGGPKGTSEALSSLVRGAVNTIRYEC